MAREEWLLVRIKFGLVHVKVHGVVDLEGVELDVLVHYYRFPLVLIFLVFLGIFGAELGLLLLLLTLELSLEVFG